MDNRDDTTPAEQSPEDGVYVAGTQSPTIPLARPVGAPVARPIGNTNPLLLLDISPSRAVVHILLLLGAFGVIMFALAVISYLLDGGKMLDESAEMSSDRIMGLTLIGGGALTLAAIAIIKVGKGKLESIGLTGRGWRLNLLLGPGVAVASYASFLLCAGLIYLLWPTGFEQLSQNPERIKDMMPDVNTGLLLLMMLGIGAYEEVVFRGFLLTHLRRLTGSWTAAILISGLIFASLHIGDEPGTQTLATAIPLFAVAVLWSLMTIWRRSLIPAIIGHALFNTAQLVVLRQMT